MDKEVFFQRVEHTLGHADNNYLSEIRISFLERILINSLTPIDFFFPIFRGYSSGERLLMIINGKELSYKRLVYSAQMHHDIKKSVASLYKQTPCGYNLLVVYYLLRNK